MRTLKNVNTEKVLSKSIKPSFSYLFSYLIVI